MLAAAAIAWLPAIKDSAIGWWILTDALAPERVLPLVGLGTALGLVELRFDVTALAGFALGIAAGFLAQDQLQSLLARLPQASSHLYLSGPIACVAMGLALLPGRRLGRWLAPLAALITGAMLATAITLTDPTLHDPTVRIIGVGTAVWIIAAVALTLRAFRQRWFDIAGRILGSWLIAIGLLYGSASLMPNRKPPPTPLLVQPEPKMEPIPGTEPPFSGGFEQNEDAAGLGAEPDALGRLRRP